MKVGKNKTILTPIVATNENKISWFSYRRQQKQNTVFFQRYLLSSSYFEVIWISIVSDSIWAKFRQIKGNSVQREFLGNIAHKNSTNFFKCYKCTLHTDIRQTTWHIIECTQFVHTTGISFVYWQYLQIITKSDTFFRLRSMQYCYDPNILNIYNCFETFFSLQEFSYETFTLTRSSKGKLRVFQRAAEKVMRRLRDEKQMDLTQRAETENLSCIGFYLLLFYQRLREETDFFLLKPFLFNLFTNRSHERFGKERQQLLECVLHCK